MAELRDGVLGRTHAALVHIHGARLVAGGRRASRLAADFGFPRLRAYVEQLQVFTKAVVGGSPPPVTGHDGRVGEQVALALLESSRTGRIVTFWRRRPSGSRVRVTAAS